MIATITVQSHRMSQLQDHRFSLTSNTAGAPLPQLPRRASSSRPTLTPSPSLPLPPRNSLSTISTSPTVTTIIPATPQQNDSDSSSSSSSPSDGTRPTIRTRRIRGVRDSNSAVCPPELSTPIPTLAADLTSPIPSSKPFKFPSQTDNAIASTSHTAPARPMLYTPGMPLRLSVESLKARNTSESQVPHSAGPSTQASQSASALCDSFGEERLIRKKSGQLVKSSLKSSRSVSRSNSLSVFTLPLSSKSEPTTPTSKAVHFDAKLEHVKLFLAEQKPLAVSRDGSPTDDTSGTDSDFPRFIFGDGTGEDDRRSKKKLIMQVPNMPQRINPNSDVVLEELTLSADGTSILGKVRVRNIAFAKWVVVRFTFDSWQTTSEVAGKYAESLSEEYDSFSFSIRLNDLLARIEGKTLLLAVKYSVEGREMWDNNSGLNYLGTFTKVKPVEESRLSPLKPRSSSDDEASTDLTDLKTKLEKVVQNERTGPAFIAQNNAQNYSRRTPTSAEPDVTSFRTSASFASRYDFAASLKSSWNPDAVIPMHARTKSFPLSATKSNGNSIPWPQTSPSDPYALKRGPSGVPMQTFTPKSKFPALGSPRDFGDSTLGNFPRAPVELEDPPFHVPQPSQARNHQRGYFDLAIPAGSGLASLKMTSPGTSMSPGEGGHVASPQRFNSFPPMESPSSAGPATSSSFFRITPMQSRTITTPTIVTAVPENTYGVDNGGDSELSTPSMVTPSSSRESSPSPTELFMDFVSDENSATLSPDTHYRQFLNKFCFFTGPGSATNHHQTEPNVEHIPRTHSASDIEEFLAGISPRLQAIANGTDVVSSPTRSPSLDDLLLNRSGSLTPTVSRLSFMNVNSQNGTPVPV